jgi:hypothetical protein
MAPPTAREQLPGKALGDQARRLRRSYPPGIAPKRSLAGQGLNRLFTIKSDPVYPANDLPETRPRPRRAIWESGMMVADMNRLEQAARVSMSGFQEAEPPPAPHSSLLLLRLGAIALLAAVALTAAWQLF